MTARLRTAWGALLAAVTLLGAPVLRLRYRRWGASAAEARAALPGDELAPEAKLTSTRGISIEAPPESVWPWLVQIGQGRGGLYSYDGLEDIIGCDIHSTDEVHPELQDLEPGDLIRLGPDGYPCYRVHSVDPGRSLVLVGADPTDHEVGPLPFGRETTGSTWQWSLVPADGGGRTRLLVRQRLTYPRSASVMWHVVEPISFVMEREMLRGIRRRAEAGIPAAGRSHGA